MSPAVLSAVAAGGVAVKSELFCSGLGAGGVSAPDADGVLALALDWGSCDRAADGSVFGAVFGSVDVAAAGAGAGEAAGAIAIGAGEDASGFVVGAIARELFDAALF
ncbi:hypothetical protein [Methylocystis rosea]|uniref:Uncharacterized protein n=1 Tax=Methylocystis rosea TaxID=173366 RepID=A0A3G8M431_9HYPH|nr:hypothetical protein [Methylocystis rosea]AZG76739.1 hypothetical protein EHO51_08375 [Methylocystis rosea]